jgi:hypothetical protein
MRVQHGGFSVLCVSLCLLSFWFVLSAERSILRVSVKLLQSPLLCWFFVVSWALHLDLLGQSRSEILFALVGIDWFIISKKTVASLISRGQVLAARSFDNRVPKNIALPLVLVSCDILCVVDSSVTDLSCCLIGSEHVGAGKRVAVSLLDILLHIGGRLNDL